MNNDWDKKIKENCKRNNKFINEFKKWLKQKKLTAKTINNHISNIDLYLNAYLNYYDIITMEDGVSEAYAFLNDWFIRKCLYSSITTIKENAASIKKFYKCMCELGYISTDDYNFVNKTISENMDDFYDSFYELTSFDDEDFF